MEQAFVSWSGGKDCCLAYHHAVINGLAIQFLVNMVNEDGKLSRSHGISAQWLQMQAQAIGIPLVQRRTTSTNYEAEFKSTISSLKKEGVSAGIFGDIDFEEHRQWIERVCADVGIKPYLPIWGENQKKIIKDFINLGFEAVVIATRADLLDKKWLGRKLDQDFVKDLAKLENITPCGEAGEYHTLVINGPLFQKSIEIIEANKILRDGHWFLEIAECKLRSKTKKSNKKPKNYQAAG